MVLFQRCSICKNIGIELNNIDNISKKLEVEERNNLKFGISPLHARIKFMEFFLHLSYRFEKKNYSRSISFFIIAIHISITNS